MGKVSLTNGHGKCKNQEAVGLGQGLSMEQTQYGWAHNARWRGQGVGWSGGPG